MSASVHVSGGVCLSVGRVRGACTCGCVHGVLGWVGWVFPPLRSIRYLGARGR
jgi:hypothetical protein